MFRIEDIKPWHPEPPNDYAFIKANVVDIAAERIFRGYTVIVSDGKIQSVKPTGSEPLRAGCIVVDCQGLFLCPGLFDAHVHFCAVPGFADLSKAFGNDHDVSLLRQPYVAAQMLQRGFTSVRDCGGAQLALKEAIEDGVFAGPRLFLSGHALSQAGGHGDIRGSHDATECCGGHTNGLGRLCNGVRECMTAVREEVRRGADFIKIMGSGGVSTPTDKLEHLQFTEGEIRAMVECANNAGTFVTAHAYTPAAIRHCIDNGCRGIEHGNFVDRETAQVMAQRDVYLTPTLVTYQQMASEKWKGYLPPESQTKNSAVFEAGLGALQIAYEAGVKMCFGTDLLGPLGAAQSEEFGIRARILPSPAVLKSATVTPATMMGQGDQLGQIKEGFLADMLILAKDPLEDVSILDDPEQHVLGVMKEGKVYKSRWPGLKEDAAIPLRLKAAL